ncbi:MAG: branched-chain amino acid transport, partial [Frankiales bacterium]|nr:branched-chain amino acid transport [Frankiales bacterium]
MRHLWLTVALVALVTFVIKGLGPALFGPPTSSPSSSPESASPPSAAGVDGADRAGLPAPLARVVLLLAPPLLAALVVTNALADGDRLAVGADTLGVATAGVLVWRGLTVLPA